MAKYYFFFSIIIYFYFFSSFIYYYLGWNSTGSWLELAWTSLAGIWIGWFQAGLVQIGIGFTGQLAEQELGFSTSTWSLVWNSASWTWSWSRLQVSRLQLTVSKSSQLDQQLPTAFQLDQLGQRLAQDKLSFSLAWLGPASDLDRLLGVRTDRTGSSINFLSNLPDQ